MAIANGAAAGLLFGPPLVLQRLGEEEGRVVWHFWTATIGSGVSVEVDDATGEARAQQSVGR